MKARMLGGGFGMFEGPGQIVGHMHGPSSRLKHRADVGFERIANHNAFGGARAVAREGPPVSVRRLVRDDLDRVEVIAKTGLGELALLIEEVTLGNQQDGKSPRQSGDGVADIRQQFDRVAMHTPVPPP